MAQAVEKGDVSLQSSKTKGFIGETTRWVKNKTKGACGVNSKWEKQEQLQNYQKGITSGKEQHREQA